MLTFQIAISFILLQHRAQSRRAVYRQQYQYARDSRAITSNSTNSNLARPPPEDPPPLPQHGSNNTHSYVTRPINSSNSSLNATSSNGLVGVRIRLNEPLFAETARLFRKFFENFLNFYIFKLTTLYIGRKLLKNICAFFITIETPNFFAKFKYINPEHYSI
jgi:hypothetical protein